MRIWSCHPRYLDGKGLTSAWREGLGALVSLDPTKGYHNHPQLDRFKEKGEQKYIDFVNTPIDVARFYIHVILTEIKEEARRRGYNFNASKVDPASMDGLMGRFCGKIEVTRGQVEYEMRFLHSKLRDRSAAHFYKHIPADRVELSSVFKLVEGDIAPWEKVK